MCNDDDDDCLISFLLLLIRTLIYCWLTETKKQKNGTTWRREIFPKVISTRSFVSANFIVSIIDDEAIKQQKNLSKKKESFQLNNHKIYFPRKETENIYVLRVELFFKLEF